MTNYLEKKAKRNQISPKKMMMMMMMMPASFDSLWSIITSDQGLVTCIHSPSSIEKKMEDEGGCWIFSSFSTDH